MAALVAVSSSWSESSERDKHSICLHLPSPLNWPFPLYTCLLRAAEMRLPTHLNTVGRWNPRAPDGKGARSWLGTARTESGHSIFGEF